MSFCLFLRYHVQYHVRIMTYCTVARYSTVPGTLVRFTVLCSYMFICYCTQINATAISSHRWLVTTGTAICFLQSSACAISRANSSDAAAVSYNNTRATAAADALSDSLRKNIGSCSAASVGVFISIPRNDPIVWQHINDVPDNMFRQA